jgi:hypothetical protein
MPIDLERLARVRAHFLTAAALVTVGCGGSSPPDHTINERVHINRPPDQAPTAEPTPDQTVAGPAPTDTPQAAPSTAPSAAPSTGPSPGPPHTLNQRSPEPVHVNKPRPSKP